MDYSSIALNLRQDEAGVLFDLDSLYGRLQTLHDARCARGKVYPLAVVFLAFVLAKLSGEDTPAGIAEWARLRTEFFVAAFQLAHPRMPHADTYRRLVRQAIPLAALNRLAQDYIDALLREPEPQAAGLGRYIHIALDGKSLRGTIPTGSSRGVHLLAAYVPAQGLVLFQVAVSDKTNEITAAPTVLQMVDLRGKIVTGDALLAQRNLSQIVIDEGGHYVWTIKENQPYTCAAIAKLFTPQTPTPGHGAVATDFRTARTVGKDHGRIETRTLTASAMLAAFLREELTWPGVQQVFRLERTAVEVATGQTRREVVYGLTSLSPAEAGPAELLQLTRDHWGIENGLHYRRDKTLREDATRMKSSTFAEALAIVNNLVIALALHAGQTNLASARRQWAANLDDTAALLLTAPSR
ncbi:MAG: ISAs1 family transposase [Geobacter sp.]|nr:MAG: ISAs1 family transposase [Geobacter sp.]